MVGSEVVKIKKGIYKKKGYTVDVIVVTAMQSLKRLNKMLKEKWFVDTPDVRFFESFDDFKIHSKTKCSEPDKTESDTNFLINCEYE